MSRHPAARVALHALCLASAGGLLAALAGRTARAADEPIVLAVVACDPHADLEKQVDWLGSVVDQPALAALVQSPLMMATQFKGLAGLDVTRPAGVVCTAEGPGNTPVVRGFVPVKNLDLLLRSLAPLIGDVVERNGMRTVAPAGMPPLQIVDREGWAIIAARGTPDAPVGLEQHLDPVVKSFSLGARLFPARLPEPLRDWIVTRAGEAAARQAQHPGAAALVATTLGRQFAVTEMLTLGLTLDIDKARTLLESRIVLTADSAAGTLADEMARAKPTAPAPTTIDGTPAAVVGHVAVAVPEPLRKQALAVLPPPDTAPVAPLAAVLRLLVPGMLDTGGIDAMLEKAAAYPSSSLHLLVRPIERGMAVRLSADPGALRLLKDVGTIAGELRRRPVGSGPVPRRRTDAHNLHLIMRGMIIHGNARGDYRFPTDIRAKDGTPLLSWRVAILRDLQGSLSDDSRLDGPRDSFEDIRLDEPWDSPHNMKVLKTIPNPYRSPSAPADQPRHMTTYVGVQGEGLFLRPDGKGRLAGGFSDGEGKTIAVIEVPPALAREWTKPDGDFPTEKEFLAAVAAWRKDGTFHAAFADGHVRELKGSDLTPADFRALLTVGAGDEPPALQP